MSAPENAEAAESRSGGFFSKPTTRLGWWSFGLAVTFVLLMLLNGGLFMQLPETFGWLRRFVLPSFGITMMLIGLSAGVTAVVAVVKRHERSWLVLLLPILVGAFAVTFMAGEFLFPH